MAAAADQSEILAQALECLRRSDWPAAHALVQALDCPLACWIHGLVHKMEGDLDNSRYWYQRAGAAARGYSAKTVQEQVSQLCRLLSTAAHR